MNVPVMADDDFIRQMAVLAISGNFIAVPPAGGRIVRA
jgi:hypothetical protein